MTAKIIDGKNAVLGRLASLTARELMAGNEIAIINSEKVIITGDPSGIVKKYLERRQRGSPQHGPFFPKQPNAIVKRAIRGMIAYKTNKGRAALKKLRVYTGRPEELKGTAASMATKPIRSDFLRVEDVAKALGWQR